MISDNTIISKANVAYIANKLGYVKELNSSERLDQPAFLSTITDYFCIGDKELDKGKPLSIKSFYYILSKIDLGYPISEYSRIEYVESSREQYIDLGIKAVSTTRIETDFQLINDGVTWNTVFGARDSPTTNAFALYRYSPTYLYQWEYGTQYATSSLWNNDTYYSKHHCETNGSTVYIDSSALVCSAQTFSTNYNLYLFASNSGGTVEHYATMRMYFFNLEQDSIKIKLIPLKRKSDGKAGLYDTIGKKFYTSNGTKDFIAGPEL